MVKIANVMICTTKGGRGAGGPEAEKIEIFIPGEHS